MTQNLFMGWFNNAFKGIISAVDAAYERALSKRDWRIYEFAHIEANWKCADLYNDACNKNCTKQQLDYMLNEFDVAGYDISISF